MNILSFSAIGQKLLVIEGDSLVCVTPNQLRAANDMYISYQECKEKEVNLIGQIESLNSLVISKGVEINLCDSLRENLKSQVALRLEQNTILNDKINILEKDKKKLKIELWVMRALALTLGIVLVVK